MNAEGIEIIKNHCKIGDHLCISFLNDEDGGEYSGNVIDMTKSYVQLKHSQELDFFETLSYPATMKIDWSTIYWFHNITTGFAR
ncbi:hypothetical protein MOB49_16050 [Bacillus haynesii]|uniref:hypothetical protein n=1 Tax=Bacillus TaxID=1386 RepID=UPI00227FC69F|nr:MULTISPECIES: hypothetical protein [Bacillus]MCY7968576.1 hypothetical protein [Bacillus haynesii]MCY8103033.1 hypothetical protein [Bacillus haynesii]MCY8152774.1 hypothetical protein [Bacillus paralicheniformis]MCY8665221.1 hypothetical protein [Bacillus haynesii]MEC1343799.1 hypothetical protein [Bacillus haynesii]